MQFSLKKTYFLLEECCDVVFKWLSLLEVLDEYWGCHRHLLQCKMSPMFDLMGHPYSTHVGQEDSRDGKLWLSSCLFDFSICPLVFLKEDFSWTLLQLVPSVSSVSQFAGSISVLIKMFLSWYLNRLRGPLPDTSPEKRICLRKRISDIRVMNPAYRDGGEWWCFLGSPSFLGGEFRCLRSVLSMCSAVFDEFSFDGTFQVSSV